MIYDRITITTPAGNDIDLGTYTRNSAGAPKGTAIRATIAPAPLRLFSEDLVQATGSIVVPGRRTAREILIEGTMFAPTPDRLADVMAEFAELFGDFYGQLCVVKYTVDGVQRRLRAAVDGPVQITRRTLVEIEFSIRMVAPDPLAVSGSVITVDLEGAPGVEAVPMGDGEAYPIYRLSGPSTGTVTALRVGNTATGDFVELDGIGGDFNSAGDDLIIDTTPGRERVTINGLSVISKRIPGSSWPRLRPGYDNELYFTVVTGSGVPSAATAEWRVRWAS